ncbi:MAG: hypothetical protein P1P72_10450 [ANME-2 cluster archaeon]|nr:hypothetical protein [ANME-2 cluster archaeon]
MKKIILILIAISFVVFPVMAEGMDSSEGHSCPEEHTCPEPGPGFGQHVSDMTEKCLQEHGGQMFGHCVSNMARS